MGMRMGERARQVSHIVPRSLCCVHVFCVVVDGDIEFLLEAVPGREIRGVVARGTYLCKDPRVKSVEFVGESDSVPLSRIEIHCVREEGGAARGRRHPVAWKVLAACMYICGGGWGYWVGVCIGSKYWCMCGGGWGVLGGSVYWCFGVSVLVRGAILRTRRLWSRWRIGPRAAEPD